MRPSVGCSNPATSRSVVVLPQRGRLAAAGGAEQREELAPRHLQVDAVHGGDVLEPLDQPDQPDLASAHRQPPSATNQVPPPAS
jgi:hypothetical protein